MKKLKEAGFKAAKGIWMSIPMLAGIILLISLASALIPKSLYNVAFGHGFLDPIIGDIVGSIMAGNPMTSYIIGGELLNQGVTLVAITAFIVAWVTVGLVQLPAEATLLGRKFAIIRNVVSFILSIAVAITTVLIMGLL